jgi:hypothetical protein
VTNAFNLILRRFIFQELRAACGNIIQFIPFVHASYAFGFPLFYNHHNRESNVIVIPSAMGTHQGNPLGGTLFILAYFRALHSTSNYLPSYLFPSIANDTPCDRSFYPTSKMCNTITLSYAT